MSHLDHNAISVHFFLVIKKQGEKHGCRLVIDFLCLRSDSLGSAVKQIIIWDITVFLFFYFIVSVLFTTCFLVLKKVFQYYQMRGACWVMVVRATRARVQEGSRQRALSNPSTVSQDESFMRAGFPSSSLDVSFPRKVGF